MTGSGLDLHDATASHAALLEHLDGITRKIVELHAPKTFGVQNMTGCGGCDFAGHEAEPPEYPCRTVRLVKAEAKRERAEARKLTADPGPHNDNDA